MSLNWVEINRIMEELPLEGCFLQNIRQTSYHHLIFELYRPGRTIQLLVCLDRSSLRLHETEYRMKSLSKPPRFTSFMRSRIKGSRITEAVQLGGERIIRLTLKKGNITHLLYIRLWGGAANLLLCGQDHLILDAFSRRPARDEVPGKPYVPEEQIKDPPPGRFTLKEELAEEESYNRAVDLYYHDRENNSELEQLRVRVRRALDQQENQYRSGLRGLKHRMAEYEKEEEFRQAGDILMASLHMIRKGDRDFIPGEETGTLPAPIRLDPGKSPVENAQDYYRRAGKASRGRSLTGEEIDHLEKQLAAISRRREKIDETDDPEALKELIPSDKPRPSGGEVKKTPGLSFRSGPFTLLVGRTAAENEALLRHHVRGNDYWLHTRDYPGGYIFIRVARGKSVPLETLLDAGNLAVFYSKAKSAGQADVYCTQVKYLRKPREGKKGLVLPTREKNMFIKLDDKRIARLKEETE